MFTLKGKYFSELSVGLGTVSKGNTFYCNLRLTLSLLGSFCYIWVTVIRFQMTRYVGSCFFTLFVLFLWRVGDIADACKCSPPHPQQAFCDAEIGKAILATFYFSAFLHMLRTINTQHANILCFVCGRSRNN